MPAFRRSRALWDETKDGGIRAWLSAICYELQPIRLTEITSNRKQVLKLITSSFQSVFCCILYLVTVGIPRFCKSIFFFVTHRNLKQWTFSGVVIIYYYFIRWIHEALDAGPIVIIFTGLTLIFTIGLSDDKKNTGISAYAVFNKGFEQLLGSIDAESLLAQHIGGGMGGAGGMMMMMNNNNNNDNDRRDDHRQMEVADEMGANNNNQNIAENQRNDNNNNENNNRTRKSGKKARRDQRREQRIRLDLDGGDIGIDGDDINMQIVIEEQIAADNQR